MSVIFRHCAFDVSFTCSNLAADDELLREHNEAAQAQADSRFHLRRESDGIGTESEEEEEDDHLRSRDAHSTSGFPVM